MTHEAFVAAVFRLPGVVYVGPPHNLGVGVDTDAHVLVVRRAVDPRIPVFVIGPVVVTPVVEEKHVAVKAYEAVQEGTKP